MLAIESFVVPSTASIPTRSRQYWAAIAVVLTFSALAVGAGFAFSSRSPSPTATAMRPKLDARAFDEPSVGLLTDDEKRLAAFQERAALSHLTLVSAGQLADDARPASGSMPNRKPEPRSTTKSAMISPPIPQPRPLEPKVISAELPPAPKVETSLAPLAGAQPFAEAIARQVERVPGQAADLASGVTDRFVGAVSYLRTRAGL